LPNSRTISYNGQSGVFALISAKTGLVADGFYTLGITWSPVYLLDGDRPVLFEGGFTCAGRMYIDDVRSILGKREPEIVFLTHVHWDHCGAVSLLKDAFPSVKIAGSERAAEILQRPNAKNLMKQLNRNVIPLVGASLPAGPDPLTDEPFRPFQIDLVVKEGDVVELGPDVHLQVLATPGHTRDLCSYHIPEKRMLVATEATGCMDRKGKIIPEFLVDYETYLSSLKRIARLPVELLCQGHHFVFTGKEEISAFFAASVTSTVRFKERVYELFDAESGSVERVMSRIKAEDYDTNNEVKQAEEAYLLNLKTRITHLAHLWKTVAESR
jgi:glyoxylase-like metal-dependent hydrolase (beta-lactamase superfamily II)